MKTRFRLVGLLLSVACLLPAVSASEETAPVSAYGRSWLFVDHSINARLPVQGEQWEVPVEYYLDPEDDNGDTALSLWCGGPRDPLGKYGPKGRHSNYEGMSGSATIQPGRGRHVFTFTLPAGMPFLRKYNGVVMVCSFRDRTGKREWDWSFYARSAYRSTLATFELDSAKPGNLFTYDQPVSITLRVTKDVDVGEEKMLAYAVHDTRGERIARGTVTFTVQGAGQELPIKLDLDRRGTFVLQAQVGGWGQRDTTFARIPDLPAITGGARTRFGMTSHGLTAPELLREQFQIARRLGLTTCRAFARWYNMQPGPDLFALDAWSQALDIGREQGVETVLTVWSPPAWVLQSKMRNFLWGYESVDVDLDAWRGFVDTATRRFKGRFYGWEWLNEILPRGGVDYASDYLDLVRIGTQTAKAIDPDARSILAGGLYPRSFRLQMLKAGIGDYIDVLPVHYQNGDGIAEALQDLRDAGHPDVAVWDDETSRPVSFVYTDSPLKDLQDTEQARWALLQYVDEIAAGADNIIYFGGQGSVGGGFDYLHEDLTPRPVAATLAVLGAKLFGAEPVGSFMLGDRGLFHLFERDGRAALVASSYREDGEDVELAVGSHSVRITDYQGNESRMESAGGVARLRLDPLRYFIEDVDADVVKAYCVPSVETAPVAAGTSVNVARAQRQMPRVSLVKGVGGSLNVRIRNLYDRRLEGECRLETPDSLPAPAAAPFSLAPGEEVVRPVVFSLQDTVKEGDYRVDVVFDFDWDKLPRVEKPVIVSVVSEDMVGNLLKNGGLETANAQRTGPQGWGVNGTTSVWAPSGGLHAGLGERVLRFQDSEDYATSSQSLPVQGGQTYLYTAWARNENMSAGSNMTATLEGGQRMQWYTNQVINCGTLNPFWQLYVCRRALPPDARTLSVTPLGIGSGWAEFDNFRITLYEGTDFTAEAHRAPNPVQVDGSLEEWNKKCPIPLIGVNQVRRVSPDYVWNPENLSGVGYLMWDDANLYVGVDVRDDVHSPAGRDEEVVAGDSVELAFDPVRGGPDAAGRAFSYYVSSALPGGGSGTHTLYRPADRSGGLRTGQLFRDSSIYELAVRPGEGRCVYELRIPFSELGGIQPVFGGRFSFSVQINDNDGSGRNAFMNWGGGISPAWQPESFGLVTFVED